MNVGVVLLDAENRIVDLNPAAQHLIGHNTESLGLQPVNTLVGQLEGSVELDSDGETTFKITFTEPMQREGGNHGADPGC